MNDEKNTGNEMVDENDKFEKIENDLTDIDSNDKSEQSNNVFAKIKTIWENKKIKLIIIIIAAVLVAIAGTFGMLYGTKVICFHSSWSEATCTIPETCERCGKTKGEPLGHDWIEADCENPKTCKICGETDGEPLGHKWKDATCENPKTCELCGKTEGKTLEHKWKEATCEKPKTCEVCGKTQGAAKGHKYDKSKICTKDTKCEVCGKKIPAAGHKWTNATCTEPKKCSVCGKTEGEALGHTTSNGKCSRCGEEIELKVLMYSDSNLDIYYTGLSEEAFYFACINFYAVNKSSKALTIQLRDESINGSMIDIVCSSDVAAGKNINADMSCYLTDLNEIGVYSLNDIESIEFRFRIFEEGNYSDAGSYETDFISIDVKNNTVSSSGGGGDDPSSDFDSDSSGSGNDLSVNAIGRLDYEVPSDLYTDEAFKLLDDSNLKSMKDNSSGVFIYSYGLIGDTYYVHLVLPYFADEYSVMTSDYDKLLRSYQDLSKAGYNLLKAYYGSGSFHYEAVVSIDLEGQQIIASYRDGLTQTDNTMDYFSLD